MFQFESRSSAQPLVRQEAATAAPEMPSPAPLRTVLSWGEHCIECAAPACYSTCALFETNDKGKCRRFDEGIVAVPLADGGKAARVRFRRWGKLETIGNAALQPDRTVTAIERTAGVLGAAAGRVGGLLAGVTGWAKWRNVEEGLHRRLLHALRRRARADRVPRHFLAEITNPGSATAGLLLTIAVDVRNLGRVLAPGELPPPFVARIALPPGISRHQIELAPAAAILGAGLPFMVSLSPEGDDGLDLLFHRLDLIGDTGAPSAVETMPAARPPAKLVILDLDNTLWNGVLLEGEVVLRPGVEALLATLDERGVLLSVASKNAPADAMARLEALGLADLLLHPQIGWLPKSQSVAAIVKALNIGADAVIFIDDNAFERAEVAQALPQVEVLPDTALATLADHPRLQGSVTPESRERRRMYQQTVRRDAAASQFGGDYIEFLRSCDIHVTIRSDRAEDHVRITELVQRTNQLNFSGRKYGAEEIAAILADPARPRHVIECSDRFGTYGTVGFCLSRIEHEETGAVLVIEDFMLSCRVQGKFIEQALLDRLLRLAGEPVARVRVGFRQTDRNRAAQMVLESLGFEAGPDGGYRRDVSPGIFSLDFLTVTDA